MPDLALSNMLLAIWLPWVSGPYCVPVLPANHARAAAGETDTHCDTHLPTSDDRAGAVRAPWFVDMVRFAFTIGFPKRVDKDTALCC